MTGGFPAEYGNRFGGVVDIVTSLRLADAGSRIRLQASAGGAGRWRSLREILADIKDASATSCSDRDSDPNAFQSAGSGCDS